MAKQEKIELTGMVIESLPGTVFQVELDGLDNTVRATLSGKMKINRIRILPGDYVTVELSPYDLTKGRITYRHKSKPVPEAATDNNSEADSSTENAA